MSEDKHVNIGQVSLFFLELSIYLTITGLDNQIAIIALYHLILLYIHPRQKMQYYINNWVAVAVLPVTHTSRAVTWVLIHLSCKSIDMHVVCEGSFWVAYENGSTVMISDLHFLEIVPRRCNSISVNIVGFKNLISFEVSLCSLK